MSSRLRGRVRVCICEILGRGLNFGTIMVLGISCLSLLGLFIPDLFMCVRWYYRSSCLVFLSEVIGVLYI